MSGLIPHPLFPSISRLILSKPRDELRPEIPLVVPGVAKLSLSRRIVLHSLVTLWYLTAPGRRWALPWLWLVALLFPLFESQIFSFFSFHFSFWCPQPLFCCFVKSPGDLEKTRWNNAVPKNEHSLRLIKRLSANHRAIISFS